MGNTILIVDDDPATLNMLEMYFSQAGFTVYTALTCKEALPLAFQYLPDCFLLDYHLGCDTPFPICQAIRSDERLKNAPIVVLSGDTSQAVYSYETCQADVFLDKDKSYVEIVAAMKRQLRRRDGDDRVMPGTDLTLDSKNMCILRVKKPDVCLSIEQFRFFSMLFERRPRFVGEEEMCRYVFEADCTEAKRKALNMVAYRLRIKLGTQLARRVKSSKVLGWVYMQPRNRHKCGSVTEKASFRS